MKKIIIPFLMAMVLSGNVKAQTPVILDNNDLDLLRDRMVGVFSSEAQSKTDTSFYFISLQVIQIWHDRKDGYWLYIEQAMADNVAKPYRQRIYHVYKQDDQTLVSKVYEIPDPLRFAGAASNPALLKPLTIESLIDRQGCAIYLHKNKQGDFYGSTPGKDCLSTLRGASYATSEVVIEKDMMLSWDRGWNENGKQVWGAVKGGYRFIRVQAP